MLTKLVLATTAADEARALATCLAHETAAEVLQAPDDSPRTLHRVAAEHGADLIVASGGVGVVHDAPCSVALAPAGWTERPLKRIGVGIDGTAASERALSVAASLARAAGAELRVVVAIGAQDPPSLASPWNYSDSSETRRDERSHRAHALIRQALEAAGGHARGEVRASSPVPALRRLSEACDLVVVGTRQRGALRRLALGSTSDGLIRSMRCPVVVVSMATAPAPAEPRHESAGV